jgi:hypothetical protein
MLRVGSMLKSAISFSTQISREVLAHKGSSRESARRHQRRERYPRNTTSTNPVCLKTICKSCRGLLITLRPTLHANKCAGSSRPVHITHDLIFPPDEGLTTAIMDMEKLKKMQQSVRIGMCDVSRWFGRSVAPRLGQHCSLFMDAVINS